MIDQDAPYEDLPKSKRVLDDKQVFIALPEREQEAMLLAFIREQEKERETKKVKQK